MLFRCLLLTAVFLAGARRLDGAINVSTDFESGSARVLELDPKAQHIRITPAGDPKRGMPNWWYLRVDGIDTNRTLVLEVAALEVGVPGSSSPNQPQGAGWTLPDRAAISTDGAAWRQSAPGERNDNRTIYRVSVPSPTLWLAWGPPFTPRDAAVFTKRIAREHSFAKEFTLAQSREERSVPALQISEGDKPATNRPALWIHARQHAWECGGSWVGVGLVEWLVSNDERAEWLRRNAEIFVVPLMDVDRVATGDGGKHALPQDHNLDWSESPHWPEIAATQKQLLLLAREKRKMVILDLHNPAPGQRLEAFYLPYPPEISAETALLQDRFLAGVRQWFGEIQLHDVKPATPEERARWKPGAGLWIRQHCGPQTISFAVETPWNTPQGTPEGYRDVGRKLGLAVEQYLREPAEQKSRP